MGAFQERAARQAPSASLPGRSRVPGIGASLFSATLAGSSLYGYPGNWSSQRINQVMHFRHWSFIAIRAYMQHVGGLTPNLGWVDKDDDYARAYRKSYGRRHVQHDAYLRGVRYRKSNRAIQAHEQVEMTGGDHPLARLLEHPNELDTQGDLYAELILFLKLTGNAYLWVVPSRLAGRDGRGLPAELWCMPSHWVHPRILRGQLPAYYDVRPFIGGGGSFKMPADEIIHLRYKNPIHKFDGYSPQTAGSEWIDVAESIDTSRFWSFKNGCFPLGSLELPEGYAEPSDQELERIYSKFFGRLRGESRFGAPVIPPPGAKYKPLMINPQEMAYPESADQMMKWCLALWGVPPEIAGIQESGSDRAAYGPENMFCRHSLDPDLRQLGAWLTRGLAHRYDERLRLWFDSTAQDDPKEVRANLQLAAANGWVTPNEGRTILLHLEPYAQGGDNPLLRGGLISAPFNEAVDAAVQKALAGPGGKGEASPLGAMGGKPAGPEAMPARTPEDAGGSDPFGKPPREESGEGGSLSGEDVDRAAKTFVSDLLAGWE